MRYYHAYDEHLPKGGVCDMKVKGYGISFFWLSNPNVVIR